MHFRDIAMIGAPAHNSETGQRPKQCGTGRGQPEAEAQQHHTMADTASAQQRTAFVSPRPLHILYKNA